MLKRGITRIIKGSWKKLRNGGKERRQHIEDQFAYPWLNSIYEELLAEHGGDLRESYLWGALQGVNLARNIGIDRVSQIELGVAGGKGLISLERIAEQLEHIFKVGIDVFGFDTSTGLPSPQDYRDSPNLYSEGHYSMATEQLQCRLKKARLITGLVEETIPIFLESKPNPIAFISFDLDLYSSTVQAFKLLEGPQECLLPRIHCYFDDIMYLTHGDFTGERLAISEFNASHSTRKIAKMYGLSYVLPWRQASRIWGEMFYLAHIFDHALYGRFDGLIKSTTRDLQTR